MLKLVSRNEQLLNGYKEYCQEFHDKKVSTFIPMKPENVSLEWFRNSLPWYQKRSQGLIEGHARSIHLWAVDENRFIGEFQLRTDLTDEIMTTIGSVGYSVRVTEQGKGYGKEILKEGLKFARDLGLKKLILLINKTNTVSRHIIEEFSGEFFDEIIMKTEKEGQHLVCRYWIHLNNIRI